jgi:3-hydroxyacyl-CoA dehydrogenase/enoyl-CoA hydratase/3-hydroxybutyryl-CoA epimerase
MTCFSVEHNADITRVTFNMPGEKVNKFNREVSLELGCILQDIQEKNPEWVVFESTKPGIFVAGADINELNDITGSDEGRELIERGQQLFQQLAKLPSKTIALIDGAALGGGLEFALACNMIVVTNSNKVRLGLPEVNLGIIPGWGGTQRLPQRIGLIRAIDTIVTGRTITAKKALAWGLVDAMVPSAFQWAALTQLIRQKKIKRRRFKRPFWDCLPGVKYIIGRKAKAAILKKTKGQYPAPMIAVDVMLQTHRIPINNGLKIECDGVVSLLQSSIPSHLMALFFSQESIKKQALLRQVTDRRVQHVGVVGAGLMGGGIGAWFIHHGQHVRLKDVNWDMIRKGYQSAASVIHKAVKRRKISAYQAPLILDRFSSTLDYSGFNALDMVIEAVPEKMTIKKAVLSDIEKQVSNQAIIATNTSSLSVTEMATTLTHPERFLGIHFFSPVHRMPLVEIIPSDKTSPQVIADACALVLKNKKYPIVVKDCPGFLINRLLLPYVNEAIHMMLQGFPVVEIDRIATDFGMPMGPLALADEVGLDIGLHVLQTLEAGYGDRMAVPVPFKEWVERHHVYGKKSGKGFYYYNTSSVLPNNELVREQSTVVKRRVSDQDRQDILDRLVLIMVNEAARCLDDGVVVSADQLDLAMIMGTGFPPFRGGLLRYADQRGLGDVVRVLNQLAQSVDQRFKPCGLLLKMSQENQCFYR